MPANIIFQAEAPNGSGVTIRWDGARELIIVAPRGHWTSETAKPGVQKFLDAVGRARVHFVGDCRLMTGYDHEVRVAWQNAFLAVRKQLSSVKFMGVSSPLVRMGITTMALVLGMDMKIVAELEGLDD
jgi:hypothetical protein